MKSDRESRNITTEDQINRHQIDEEVEIERTSG